jgi:hypothetical protein
VNKGVVRWQKGMTHGRNELKIRLSRIDGIIDELLTLHSTSTFAWPNRTPLMCTAGNFCCGHDAIVAVSTERVAEIGAGDDRSEGSGGKT